MQHTDIYLGNEKSLMVYCNKVFVIYNIYSYFVNILSSIKLNTNIFRNGFGFIAWNAGQWYSLIFMLILLVMALTLNTYLLFLYILDEKYLYCLDYSCKIVLLGLLKSSGVFTVRLCNFAAMALFCIPQLTKAKLLFCQT